MAPLIFTLSTDNIWGSCSTCTQVLHILYRNNTSNMFHSTSALDAVCGNSVLIWINCTKIKLRRVLVNFKLEANILTAPATIKLVQSQVWWKRKKTIKHFQWYCQIEHYCILNNDVKPSKRNTNQFKKHKQFSFSELQPTTNRNI